MNGVVKVDKKLLNELLYYIALDNRKYGLIFKLVYVYGRKIHEVLKLKVCDVDKNTIEFELPTERFNFVLYDGLKKPLFDYIEEKELGRSDYIFITDERDINNYSKGLNYYLKSKINELNKTVLSKKCPLLVNTDFKYLRGQHLFLDGVNIKVINELYRNKNIQTTKNNISYDDLVLYRDRCNNVEKIIKDCTDLRVFHDTRFDERDIFLVRDEGCGDEVIFEYDYLHGVVNWVEVSNPNLVSVFERKCVDCDLLRKLDVGDYLLFGDLRIIKN